MLTSISQVTDSPKLTNRGSHITAIAAIIWLKRWPITHIRLLWNYHRILIRKFHLTVEQSCATWWSLLKPFFKRESLCINGLCRNGKRLNPLFLHLQSSSTKHTITDEILASHVVLRGHEASSLSDIRCNNVRISSSWVYTTGNLDRLLGYEDPQCARLIAGNIAEMWLAAWNICDYRCVGESYWHAFMRSNILHFGHPESILFRIFFKVVWRSNSSFFSTAIHHRSMALITHLLQILIALHLLSSVKCAQLDYFGSILPEDCLITALNMGLGGSTDGRPYVQIPIGPYPYASEDLSPVGVPMTWGSGEMI